MDSCGQNLTVMPLYRLLETSLTGKQSMRFSHPLGPAMHVRSFVPELMEGRDVDEKELFRTLEQFRTINRFFSGIHGLLNKVLLNYIRKHPSPSGYSIIDLGTGGCDIPLWLIGQCRRMGQPVRITGIDQDPRVIAYIKRTVPSIPELTVCQATAHEALLNETYDFILSNHFLHHLCDREIPSVLRLMHTRSRIGYICNDLRRSRLALLLFAIIAPVLFKNSLTTTDGIRSIRKGFRFQELRAFTSELIPSPVLRAVIPYHLCLYHMKGFND